MKRTFLIFCFSLAICLSSTGQNATGHKKSGQTNPLILKNLNLSTNQCFLNTDNLFSPLVEPQKSVLFSTITNDSIITDNYNIQINDWEKYRRRIYYFSPQWQTLYYIDYTKPDNSFDWVPAEKRENANNTVYRWDKNSGNWVDSLKVEYTETGAITYLWNESGGTWDPFGNTEFLYNNQDEYVGNTYYVWNKTASDWSKYSQTEKSFNNNSELQYTYLWNASTSHWDDSEKIEYIDNQDGDVGLANYYHWSTTANDWILYKKDDYSYFKTTGTGAFSIQIATSLKDLDQETWAYSSRLTIYYGEHNPTSVFDPNINSAQIYPNPFNEEIKINNFLNCSCRFRLYDLTGKLVLEKLIGGKNTICTKELNNGLYFYKMELDGKILTGKLLKED